MHHDVIVVGAGPGGCAASRVLAGYGFKVLILEREAFPREKPCGGFLSPEAVRLVEGRFGPIPPECLAEPGEVRGARLACEGGGTYDLPFSAPGRSVLRSRLDAWLAANCGAELMDGCRVVGFDAGRFHMKVRITRNGSEEEMHSTYLVGTDGADSMVLRNLRPAFHRLYTAPRLRRNMLVFSGGELDWDPDLMGLVLLRRARGIDRVFVKNGLIGLAIDYDDGRGWREGLDELAAFLRERAGLRLEGEGMRFQSTSNRMASSGDYSLGAGCVLLAGEATGLLDPWGFGIRLAVESGLMAGECIAESAGESITPHIRYRYRMQAIVDREREQRRSLAGGLGDLDTSSLVDGGSRTARRDRRALRRRVL